VGVLETEMVHYKAHFFNILHATPHKHTGMCRIYWGHAITSRLFVIV